MLVLLYLLFRSVDYCGLVYTQVYQYSRTLTDRAHTLNRLFSKVGAIACVVMGRGQGHPSQTSLKFTTKLVMTVTGPYLSTFYGWQPIM
jgi:hypothetical protein